MAHRGQYLEGESRTALLNGLLKSFRGSVFVQFLFHSMKSGHIRSGQGFSYSLVNLGHAKVSVADTSGQVSPRF